MQAAARMLSDRGGQEKDESEVHKLTRGVLRDLQKGSTVLNSLSRSDFSRALQRADTTWDKLLQNE